MHTSVYRKPKMNIQIINVKVSGASVDPDLIDIFTIYWLQKIEMKSCYVGSN
jgi:hypothetical protein